MYMQCISTVLEMRCHCSCAQIQMVQHATTILPLLAAKVTNCLGKVTFTVSIAQYILYVVVFQVRTLGH